MKKYRYLSGLTALSFMVVVGSTAYAATPKTPPELKLTYSCTTIKSGTLKAGLQKIVDARVTTYTKTYPTEKMKTDRTDFDAKQNVARRDILKNNEATRISLKEGVTDTKKLKAIDDYIDGLNAARQTRWESKDKAIGNIRDNYDYKTETADKYSPATKALSADQLASEDYKDNAMFRYKYDAELNSRFSQLVLLNKNKDNLSDPNTLYGQYTTLVNNAYDNCLLKKESAATTVKNGVTSAYNKYVVKRDKVVKDSKANVEKLKASRDKELNAAKVQFNKDVNDAETVYLQDKGLLPGSALGVFLQTSTLTVDNQSSVEISVKQAASSKDSIKKVAFYVDKIKSTPTEVKTATDGIYKFTWNLDGVSKGKHKIYAYTFDSKDHKSKVKSDNSKDKKTSDKDKYVIPYLLVDVK